MTVGGVHMIKMYASWAGFTFGGTPPVWSSSLKLKICRAEPQLVWCLLSITGLTALGWAMRYHHQQISPCWVIFFQPARWASVLGRFSSLRPHWLRTLVVSLQLELTLVVTWAALNQQSGKSIYCTFTVVQLPLRVRSSSLFPIIQPE